MTQQLDEFWSHSWRTSAGLKYVNILFLNNGFPAFVVGTLCALVAFSLKLAGILPLHGVAGPANTWCTIAGSIGYYVTLLFWPSRTRAAHVPYRLGLSGSFSSTLWRLPFRSPRSLNPESLNCGAGSWPSLISPASTRVTKSGKVRPCSVPLLVGVLRF